MFIFILFPLEGDDKLCTHLKLVRYYKKCPEMALISLKRLALSNLAWKESFQK